MPDTGAVAQACFDDFVAPYCDDVLKILYQDDDILIIDKPSGLLTLSGKNPLNWDSVHHRLVHGQAGVTAAFPNASLPHRLDFGTSGLMLVALNAHSAQQLNKQFQTQTIKKRYIALLEGKLADNSGKITAAIAKDKSCFPRVEICLTSGKAACTEFKVLQRLEQPLRTLVTFTPLTGRTHQLRIHSHFIGHPILGCDLYKSTSSQQMASRLLLHASDIYFQHPRSRENLHGHSPCPF